VLINHSHRHIHRSISIENLKNLIKKKFLSFSLVSFYRLAFGDEVWGNKKGIAKYDTFKKLLIKYFSTRSLF
jgi:hypothetical protein